MKTGTTISLLCLGPVCMLIGLQACEKPSTLYADAPQERPRTAVAVAGAPAAYIGTWAATAANCGAQSWTLTKEQMQTPDGTVCDIVGADATPAGYSASSMCSGPKLVQPKSGRMVLTLTGPGRGNSLSISESPLGGAISLVRCTA